MDNILAFRRRLLRWYDRNARKLPWREPGSGAWRILVSEIMLQQTRVEAVIPYYERFLARFPDARALADASEPEILAAWSGLGYYSRVRNLQRAARAILAVFPMDYEGIRALPGVGPYTAAAVASIGFGLPYAAVDGNVLRVIARVTGDAGDIGSSVIRRKFALAAEELLDPVRPGDFNQAMMELGATVCVPRKPKCLLCPVARDCVARQQARQSDLPFKRAKAAAQQVECGVVVIRRGPRVLLRQRAAEASRMAGFWELPALEDFIGAGPLVEVGEFSHSIVNTRYRVRVWEGRGSRARAGYGWFSAEELERMPLTTMAKKALRLGKAERDIP